jgi:Holliday junction resolvase RusA-like endonuclease
MGMISVWVPGHPRTKGSTRRQGGRIVRADTDASGHSASATWEFQVQQAVATRPLGDPRLTGPVFVRATFWLPVADVTVKGSGDLDKLLRSVLDALTRAGVYGDDAQVTRSEQVKYGCLDGEPMGVLLEFEPDDRAGSLRSALTMNRWRAMRAQGLT